MAGRSPFGIDITANNKVKSGLAGAQKDFEKAFKGTGLEKLSGGFGNLGERAKALVGLGRNFGSFATGARFAAAGAEEAAGGISEVAAAAGLAGVATVGVVGALGLGAAAAIKFEDSYGRAGVAVGRLSALLGENAQTLQLFEIAGHKAGVSTEAMDQAFQGLGNTLEDAAAGRNQAALSLLNRLHIAVRRLPNGAIDAGKAMQDLGSAMQGQNPQARQLIASTFGISSAIQFLIQTDAQRQAQLDQAARSGAVRSQQQIDSETKMQQATSRLGDAWHGLLNMFETKAIIPWLEPLETGLANLLNLISGVKDATTGGVASGGGSGGGAGASASGGKSVNNPGNIRGPGGQGFRQFDSIMGGLQAQADLLLAYGAKHHLDTISGIISRWAPRSENDTGGYIRDVEKWTGFNRNAHLDLSDPVVLARLMMAMMRQEHGRPMASETQVAQAAKHEIEIRLHGAPAGTTARVVSPKTSGVKIGLSMSGSQV